MNSLVQKIIKYGAKKLSDDELLALLLMTNGNHVNAIAIARSILDISGLNHLEFIQYKDVNWLTSKQYSRVIAFIELHNRYNEFKSINRLTKVNSSKDVAQLFEFLTTHRHESFYILILDSGYKIITYRKLFSGDQSKVYINARKVIELALSFSAYAIAFIHNHPDGNCQASANDLQTMHNLFSICEVVGIIVYDSIIVARNGYYSFKTKNIQPIS